MKIAFGNDHAGLELRRLLLKHLKERGCEILDYGVDTEDSVDYPDIAEKTARAVQCGEADLGVLICGTGVGICMAANKMRGIRCALCHDEYSAEMARAHNNANIIALRGRQMDPKLNIAVLDKFLDTTFSGGRHQRRLDKIAQIEQREAENSQPCKTSKPSET